MSAAVFIRHCSRELNQPVFRRVLFQYGILMHRLLPLYLHIVDIPCTLFGIAVPSVLLNETTASFGEMLLQREEERVNSRGKRVHLTKLVKVWIKRTTV